MPSIKRIAVPWSTPNSFRSLLARALTHHLRKFPYGAARLSSQTLAFARRHGQKHDEPVHALDHPTPGDPTYSLLKAHLLFEELLRTYLVNTLPHASALDGARLTFAQVLAVARACNPHVNPGHWIWKAIGDLNREAKGHLYSAIDVVTFGLYYFTAVILGFNVDQLDRDQEGRSEAIIQANSTTPLADDAPNSPREG